MTRVLLLLGYAVTLVSFGVVRQALSMPVKSNDGPVAIHVLAANDDGELVAEDVTQPLLAFRVEEGKVDQAAILECQQTEEMRDKDGIQYPVIVLKCGSVRMVLVGLDLTVKGAR